MGETSGDRANLTPFGFEDLASENVMFSPVLVAAVSMRTASAVRRVLSRTRGSDGFASRNLSTVVGEFAPVKTISGKIPLS
jgi:hypothetical protein